MRKVAIGSVLVVGLALCGGSAPAASTSGPIYTLTSAETRAVEGYTLSVSVDANPGRRPETLLELELARKVASATQQHDFTFQLPAFTCAVDLRSCAPIRARRLMGSYGSVSLRFVPRGRQTRVPVDFPSCTGRKTQRAGELIGTLRLRPHNPALPAHRGNFRVRATAASETIYSCNTKPVPTFCHQFGLAGVDDAGSRYFAFLGSTTGGRESGVVHVGQKVRGLKGATVGHSIVYSSLPTVLTTDAAQSHAHVDSAGVPFLSGSADYTADGRPPVAGGSRCGSEIQTSGTASGDLTVHFDGMAPTPVVPTNAVLWRRP